MINFILGNILSSILIFLPFALLFLMAFRKSLRFSEPITLVILIGSVLIHTAYFHSAHRPPLQAVNPYNFLDLLLMFSFFALTIKSRMGRMLFIGLILKNTADAVAIFAKCLEYLIVPRDALMGYYWTYSVALIVVELLVIPPVYYIIKRYFTYEIRETISKRWRYIWAVPFFFYLSGLYVFSIPSVESDLELACMPMNSIFLLCSICCQYTIYISLATLVKSLQRQAQLQEENHAIQLQAIQYDYIQNQISEDRRLRHDLRHHFTVINSLVEGQEYERLGKYLSEYITPALWQSQVHYCPNAILNIMASYYANKCYSNSIACYIRLNVPEQLPLSDTEITVLFGNLLENAFNACIEIPEGQSRSLALRGELINDSLLFTLENSYLKEGTKLKKGEKACPHKGMGIGISSCQNIVNAHNGSMEIDMSEIYVVKLFFEFMR